MTPQEAIEILEMFLHKQCDLERTKFAYSENTIWIAVNMAKQALEKQIPKKPKPVTDPMFGDTMIVCPNCGNANLANPFVVSRVYDYCPNCGQALDWSDDN